ncbi:MAG TPA: hypothetical protein VE134_06570, partial [Methanomicrobiales archaeon]|nr:hypothetical protein [Methanomicrobiales archaeon]
MDTDGNSLKSHKGRLLIVQIVIVILALTCLVAPLMAGASDAPKPSIKIQKYTNGELAVIAPGPQIPVGSDVVWTYNVTNTGNVPLADVVVTDDKEGYACGAAELQPGGFLLCTLTGTAQPGPYQNTATVEAEAPYEQQSYILISAPKELMTKVQDTAISHY